MKMPSNATEYIRTARRNSIVSALCSGGWLMLCAAAELAVRHIWFPDGAVSAALLILAVWNLVCLLPLALSLRRRLKEIQGGEEYEARHY